MHQNQKKRFDAPKPKKIVGKISAFVPNFGNQKTVQHLKLSVDFGWATCSDSEIQENYKNFQTLNFSCFLN